MPDGQVDRVEAESRRRSLEQLDVDVGTEVTDEEADRVQVAVDDALREDGLAGRPPDVGICGSGSR